MRLAMKPSQTTGHTRGRPYRLVAILTPCVAIIAVLWLGTAVWGVTFEPVSNFGGNPGNLKMYKYVPDDLPASSPLVVLLHGCLQFSGPQYAKDTGWPKLAEEHHFALLVVEKLGGQCFNWFIPEDQERDGPEPKSIQHTIEKMKADEHIDPSQIYISGLCAGAAMTAVMLAVYPEDFAGGAIIAGLPYKSAHNQLEAQQEAMKGKVDLTPAQWGDLVRQVAHRENRGLKVSIWHSEGDPIVQTNNARELVEQWTNVLDIDQPPDGEDVVKGHRHIVYKDAQGTVRVERYYIKMPMHGTPVDPGPEPDQGGQWGSWVLATTSSPVTTV